MALFQREQRSLFGEILDWMLAPLLLLWPASLALTWLVAQSIAGKPFDRALEYNVQALAQLVTTRPPNAAGGGGNVGFYLPQPAREILRADEADQVYFQVAAQPASAARGMAAATGVPSRLDLVSGERDLPPPPADDESRLVPGEVKLRDDEIRGQGVRVAWTWVRAEPAAGAAPNEIAAAPLVLVQVAETLEKRGVLATEIIKGVMLPQFVILPLAVLLVWLALVRGIKPLSQLEERIRARRPDDLSPLDDKAVPLEVAPLVSSVNDLLGRLKDSISTQKRFLADAAHQLKTPLAGLRMQADIAEREATNAQELKLSLKQIGRSSRRATHVVNQLLALARVESGDARGAAGRATHRPTDLVRIVTEAVQDALPRALERGIDLGYEGPAAGAGGAPHASAASSSPWPVPPPTHHATTRVTGDPTLLGELVRNLLDNAIAYTPAGAGGVVTARVVPDPFGQVVLLQVEDSGPGIAEAERELVFQPFYRVLGSNVDGSGLGLSIVREIASQHRATVTLEDAHPGPAAPGLRVNVRFALGE